MQTQTSTQTNSARPAKAELVNAADPTSRPQRIRMTAGEWAKINDNPRQRDTERHARKVKKHLETVSPTHCVVAMAVTPSNRQWKLDGHTRSYLWEAGEIPVPEKILVDVYQVANRAEAAKLYTHFDSKQAVQTGMDDITSAVNQFKAHFVSPLLAAYQFGSAVKRAERYINASDVRQRSPEYTFAATKAWLPELKLVDQCDPHRPLWSSGILSAALLTFRVYGDHGDVTEFWQRFSSNDGERSGGLMDGVQGLYEATLRKDLLPREQMRIGIHACESFLRDKRFRNRLSVPGDAAFAAFMARVKVKS